MAMAQVCCTGGRRIVALATPVGGRHGRGMWCSGSRRRIGIAVSPASRRSGQGLHRSHIQRELSARRREIREGVGALASEGRLAPRRAWRASMLISQGALRDYSQANAVSTRSIRKMAQRGQRRGDRR